jgi:rubrerythrin
MKILNLLSSLEKIEVEMAGLYEWLSSVFTDDTEASGLFFRMAMQERSHANLIRYGKKLVHQAPKDFAEVDFDSAAIGELLDAIRAAKDSARPPSLEGALLMALQFEDSPAETAHRSILMSSNPAVREVIQSLAAADEEHAKGLRAFAASRGLVVDEPTSAAG